MSKTDEIFDKAINKVVERINNKRRQELIQIYSNDKVWEYVRQIKNMGLYDGGSKSKVWKKVASMPLEVDLFFTRVYGEDYYKDPDFFEKHHPEWKVSEK